MGTSSVAGLQADSVPSGESQHRSGAGLVGAYWLVLPVLVGLLAGANRAGQLITDLPRPVGMGYWVAVAFFLWWTPAVLTAGLLRLSNTPRSRPAIAGVLVVCCAVGIFFSRIPHRGLYAAVAGAIGVEDLPFTHLYPASLGEFLHVLVTFSPFMITWLLVSVFFLFVLRAPLFGKGTLPSTSKRAAAEGPGSAPYGASNQVDSSMLLAELPPGYREIVSIKAEDHYVRVRTDAGQRMVLMKFADAISQLSLKQGMRVHRSYWANLDRAVEFRRNGQRLELVLDTGEVIPVSRRYAEAVRIAWEHTYLRRCQNGTAAARSR